MRGGRGRRPARELKRTCRVHTAYAAMHQTHALCPIRAVCSSGSRSEAPAAGHMLVFMLKQELVCARQRLRSLPKLAPSPDKHIYVREHHKYLQARSKCLHVKIPPTVNSL